MAVMHHVEGYESFKDYMNKMDNNDEPVFVLFSGKKLPSGDSWCSDCVDADPMIQEAIKYLPNGSHFILCEVGDRPYWKNMKCPFRIDRQIHIEVLPTIVKWRTQKRLEGAWCQKLELLEMLFTEVED